MGTYDIVVIGGGTTGLTVATGSAKLGLKVAIIEKEKLGGDCLYYGCVPSKTLIHSAKVASLIKRAKEYGLNQTHLTLEFKNVIKHVWDVINIVEEHDKPDRFISMGVDVIFGDARFISSEELAIDDRIINSRKFVICTGSKASIPPIEGLYDAGYITHVEVFHLSKLPKSLIVIGGGPIGMEMAQAFARFGCEVSTIEIENRVLPVEDEDVSEEIERIFSSEGINIFTGARIKKIYKKDLEKYVVLQQNSKEYTLRSEEILIAAGRTPNVESLNLEAAGVQYNKRGIIVNAKLQTTKSNIWACGDVVGPYLFTHMAEYQAAIVIRNAVLKIPTKADYSVVPWTTFTDPEVAHVGITEIEAQKRNVNFSVYKNKFENVDRAITSSENSGFIKIIASGWKGKIIGASIIGPNAGELISELTLAIKNKLSLKDISLTIHVYPTLALGMRQTSDLYFRNKFESSRWIQKLIRFYVKLINI